MTTRKTFKRAILLGILFVMITASSAFAASVSISASKTSVSPGDTVTVTVSFSGKDIIGIQANVSADGSVTTGGGTVLYAEGSTNSYSQSFSIKANKVGTGKVTVSDVMVSTIEEDSTLSSKSVTINVVAPQTDDSSSSDSSSDSSSSGSTGSTDSSSSDPNNDSTDSTNDTDDSDDEKEEEEEDPLAHTKELTVDGKTALLWTDLSDVEVFEGFTVEEVEYDGQSVEMMKHEERGYYVAYFTDDEGENPTYQLYNEERESFYPYVTIDVARSYVLLQPEESVEVPQGYEESEITIDGERTVCWVQSDGENSDFVLVYAINEDGEKGFYFYDTREGSMQRYVDRSIEVVEEVPVEESAMEKIFNDPVLASILGILGLAVAGLAAALIRILQKNKNR
ncbi:MAG TPA: hypothetical protein DHN33_04145 [Eubacteriaceae bacterium]|nr:hypothetical protein [Eubacteriaceae bacterium]